jgi:hypothetical protein
VQGNRAQTSPNDVLNVAHLATFAEATVTNNPLRQCTVVAALTASIGSTIGAQTTARGQNTGTLGAAIVFQRDTRERWLNGRQHAAFTVMTDDERRVRIVGITGHPPANGRIFDFTFQVQFGQPGTARISTDERGRVLAMEGSFHEPVVRKTGGLPPMIDSAMQLRWEIFNGVDYRAPSLPEARVWDLIPVLGGASLHTGARWIDTLNLSAALGDYSQVLRGVRTSMVIGDTVVAGTQLWIVRDTAAISYAERFVTDEQTARDH